MKSTVRFPPLSAPRGAGSSDARHRERGQTLVELALTIVLFLMLSLGIVEFGRVLMIYNVVTHAARDAARAAAVQPASNRDVNGLITNWSGIQTVATDQVSFVTSAAVNFAHAQPSTGGIPMVEVTVSLPAGIPYLAKSLLFPAAPGTGFTVSRTVRFRDEGR